MTFKYLTAALLILCGVLMTPLFADEPAPQQLIRQTADDVLSSIKTHQVDYKKEPAKLYSMVDEKVLPHFDFDRMTDLALGRFKRQVDNAQKVQLVTAFRNLLVRTYGKALLEYTNQEIQYLPLRGKLAEGDVTIRTEIEQQGGFPIPINYDMYLRDGNWKVYDITIDNISLVTNYRSSFAQEIKANGVESLIKTLQDKNKQES